MQNPSNTSSGNQYQAALLKEYTEAVKNAVLTQLAEIVNPVHAQRDFNAKQGWRARATRALLSYMPVSFQNQMTSEEHVIDTDEIDAFLAMLSTRDVPVPGPHSIGKEKSLRAAFNKGVEEAFAHVAATQSAVSDQTLIEIFFSIIQKSERTNQFLILCNKANTPISPALKKQFKDYLNKNIKPDAAINEIEEQEILEEAVEEKQIREPQGEPENNPDIIETEINGNLIKLEAVGTLSANKDEKKAVIQGGELKNQGRAKKVAEALVAAGFKPVEIFSPKIKSENNTKYPYKIVQVCDAEGKPSAQVAVNDHYSFALVVIRDPVKINVDGDNDISIKDLKFMEFSRIISWLDEERATASVVSLIKARKEDLPLQHKVQVDWRSVTRDDVLDTVRAYIVKTGELPLARGSEMIEFGALAFGATCTKFYTSLNKGRIQSFEKNSTFNTVYQKLCEAEPSLKKFYHAEKRINLKEVFDDAQEFKGELYELLLSGEFELAGYTPGEIGLAAKYDAFSGWDETLPAEAHSARDFNTLMQTLGIAPAAT